MKIFRAQSQEAERFEKVGRNFEKNNIKIVVTRVASSSLVQLVVGAGVGLIVFFFLNMHEGEIEVGEFLAFIAAVAMIQKPMKQLNQVNEKIQRGIIGAASLFELLDLEAERDSGTCKIDRARGELEFRNVSFSYADNNPVLKNLSFSVKAGETVALVGRSGAGKTTVAAMVPRFYDAAGGDIFLDGKPLTSYTIDSLVSRCLW